MAEDIAGGGEDAGVTGVRRRVRGRVVTLLSDRRQVEDGELYELIDGIILETSRTEYLPLKERICMRSWLFDSFRRLGLLQELLDNPEITEIMVNGREHIFIEKKGRLTAWDKCFETSEQLEDIIQQIVSRVDRMVNVSNPIADARLEDGSRVHVVLPPVALDGPALTIRKFPIPITMSRLIRLNAITTEAAEVLKKLVASGYNLFISGGTGSGKSTFLNALSAFIPAEERLVTIEDSAELQIRHIPNLVRMETRPPNMEGEGELTMAALIKASLRMRPDRIIVGEVRGKEALDMISAMNTGHDGCLSTGHGNNPKDMLSRLETMMLMGADLPLGAIRSQIASAVDILVHLGRMRDRSRKVLSIAEIVGVNDGEIELNYLYAFEEEPGQAAKTVRGALKKTGELKNRGKLKGAGYSL